MTIPDATQRSDEPVAQHIIRLFQYPDGPEVILDRSLVLPSFPLGEGQVDQRIGHNVSRGCSRLQQMLYSPLGRCFRFLVLHVFDRRPVVAEQHLQVDGARLSRKGNVCRCGKARCR